MSWGIVASVVGSVVVASMNDDGGSSGQASSSASTSNAYYDSLAKIGNEQWEVYKAKVAPLLDDLRGSAATPDRTAEVQAQAAGDVKGAYAGQKAALERKIGQTRNAGDPGFSAALAPLYGAEASDISRAMTAARTAEQNRVENTNWDRKLQTIGAYQGLPQQATSALNAAASGQGANASRFSALSQQSNQNAAQMAYGGASLAANANKWFNNLGGRPATQAPVEERNIYSAGYDYDAGGGYNFGDFEYADGGMIGRRRYAEGGPVDGPGTGTSDSVMTKKRPGTYILSADTVRAVGTQKLRQIAEKAGVRPGDGEDAEGGGTPVRLSRGEWAIPSEVVDYHGEEFFSKMQQKYHRPLASDDGMANGGVIRRRKLPVDVENAIFGNMPAHAIGRRR